MRFVHFVFIQISMLQIGFHSTTIIFLFRSNRKKKEKEKSKCGGILHMVWTFCKLSQHSVPPVLLCQTVLCCRCHRFPSLRLRIRFVISSFRLPIFPLRLQRTPNFSCIHAIYILILFSICSSRALKRSNPYTC